MSQFRNLVFEGGGVKGIAYVGAMEVLERRGIFKDIKRVGGTSAGAINAVLLACGYSNAEQQKILFAMEFERFMDDDHGLLRDTNRLLHEYGWHKGDYFRRWMGDLIEAKMTSRDVTFSDLKRQGCPDLYLLGANLSTGFGEVFSVEHTPNMRVVDAVRISMSIPLFFAAVRAARGDVYVDGGLLNNYPVKLFDREKYVDDAKASVETGYYADENKRFLKGPNKNSSRYIYNKQTLGFRLDSKQEIAAFRYGAVQVVNRIDDFFGYTRALVRTVLNVQESLHLHSDDWHRTVYIDTLGVGTTEFDVSDKKKQDLVKSGRKHAEDYFAWFDRKRADREPGEEEPENRV